MDFSQACPAVCVHQSVLPCFVWLVSQYSSYFIQCWVLWCLNLNNGPFLSSLVPLFQNESKCETFQMKMTSSYSFICMQIKVILIRMVSHLDSLGHRGTRELRNGLLLFPVDCNTHKFFATFRVMFLMLWVCLKPITWYIEMHHVRTFFLSGVMTFSYCDVHSQHFYLQEESLPGILLLKKNAENFSWSYFISRW